MIEHIRYEVEQIVQLSRFGNGWCELLRPDLGEFAQRSILEAGLLHFRCLIEFLGERPTSDQVRAQDYVKGWDWKISDKLSQVGELQGRLAHLGTARRRVATDGGFSWNVWIIDEAPVVLRSFRDFLMQLRTSSPQWYQMFIQPRDDLPVIDCFPFWIRCWRTRELERTCPQVVNRADPLRLTSLRSQEHH